MKGLNVKKLAAIGVGAALVGSALAPIASAAISLEKSQIIGSNGAPVVDIVVGAGAAASDVVWAGNIAAKVAQLATIETPISSAGGTGEATVTPVSAELTVGGTVTITGGAREEITANLDSASSTKEYVDTIGNSYFTNFKNESKNIKIDNNTTATTVAENIGVQIDAAFDTTHSNVNDLIATLSAGDLNYTLSFTPTIAQFTDSGSDDYAPISFLGENWVIDSITSNMVTLVKSDAEKVYSVGEEIPIAGLKGEAYKYKLTGGGVSGTTNNVTIQLVDGNSGTVLQTKQFDQGADVDFTETSTGNSLISTKVNVKKISKTTQNNSDVFSFTLLVGNDRIQLKDGGRFPYDPNNTTGSFPWIVSLTYSSNKLSQITVKNSAKVWDSDHPLYSEAYSFLRAGSSVATAGSKEAGILEGSSYATLGKVKFKGFYDAGVQKSVVKFLKTGSDVTGDVTTYGSINYFDTGNIEHKIPMAIRLSSSSNLKTGTFTFEGIQYAYAVNIGYTGDSTQSGRFFSLDQGSTSIRDLTSGQADVNFSQTTDTATTNTWTDAGDINAASPIISLTGRNSKTYRYVYKIATGGAWLVLAGRGDFNSLTGASGVASGTDMNHGIVGINSGYIDTTYQNTGSLWFLGTSMDDVNAVEQDVADFNTWHAANSIANQADTNNFTIKYGGVSYYAPDTTDFGLTAGSSTGNIYKTAVFKIKEIDATAYTAASTTMPNAGTAQGSWDIYWDTEGGAAGTVDTANNSKTGYAGKSVAALYYGDKNLNNLSAYSGSSTNYTKAYDDNGAKVELTERELTFTLPSSRMKTYVTIESNTVKTSTTGEKLTVNSGETGTTTSGTKVTVDKINATGTCSAVAGSEGTTKEIVKVGQLVYLDNDVLPAGNHIIVGGYLVNSLAEQITLADGSTLQDKLVSDGDKVAEALENGDIIAAGYNADDTASAAGELVDALDNLN